MPDKTVLILGGGVGGVVAANLLRKKVGRAHRIVVVDKESRHYFAPSFPWVATGSRQASTTYRELNRLSHKGIEFLQQEVEKLDPERNVVVTKEEEFRYDYLVVALGAELAPEIVPGLSDTAHTYYTLDGALRLHQALQDFKGGNVAFLIASLPFK